jgi:hypothetical protein
MAAEHRTYLLLTADEGGVVQTFQGRCNCGWTGETYSGSGAAREEAQDHHEDPDDRLVVSRPTDRPSRSGYEELAPLTRRRHRDPDQWPRA